MSGLAKIVAMAALITSTAAFAGPTQLTDSQYIAAAHCQGLFDSHALGPVDATGINALMKTEGRYRSPEISDRAAEARTTAMDQANRAGALMKTQLAAQRDGACQTWARAETHGGVAAAGN